MAFSDIKARFWRRCAGRVAIAVMACVLAFGSPAQAAGKQDLPEDGPRGAVTNLPLPRYVSMKAADGNARRGPSLSNRIDWVFMRRNMPLQLTAEYGHWRKVQDRDGAGGWVHYALLSGVRTVLVEKDMLQIYARPDPQSPVKAALELGVIARLGSCQQDWCKVTAGGYRGWAPKSALWGVQPDELRD